MGYADGSRFVQVSGDSPALVERLRGPLTSALGDRHSVYAVRLETVGRVGEILVSISGSKGRLPLLFSSEELADAGYTASVVGRTVARFDF